MFGILSDTMRRVIFRKQIAAAMQRHPAGSARR
ncbi:hypothetical protein SEA_TRAAWW1_52 [Mycobacterium phage Traaww1]|uniref:Uncharacterized protein n=1 Tax=Mycobacterium phage 244 TaxID=2902792 RepID=Q1A114_9CAUD|nr:gp57 [Mycobacterium phage 244]AXH49867.1 hypothetical protein SEA_GLEXAN_54 [Mycobacterium phage Glexan]QAY06584.1 hypothetical protein SEA_COOKIES_53 [Mycobacterium phage Cookies]QDH92018.1 hypothetical protein SEA_FLYPOTENUSE_51 [Mycobacterium phage Flypotenuse]QGJ91964.1 hypothetical protein SEA_TRAAWW1_52 [Mycobacterium phage Traaww1]QPL14789.1 hypothetical protein SEA_HARELLA_56 [Mycobacterium phage Harella]